MGCVGEGVLELAGESESSPEVKRGEYWANIVSKDRLRRGVERTDMSPKDEGGEVGRDWRCWEYYKA